MGACISTNTPPVGSHGHQVLCGAGSRSPLGQVLWPAGKPVSLFLSDLTFLWGVIMPFDLIVIALGIILGNLLGRIGNPLWAD